MRLKFKPLKVWQAILLVIGVILLAGAGAFLYVYLTKGLEPEEIYPEEISFVVDDQNNFNVVSGQYETAGNFEMSISTQTENVNEVDLTLSFTINFTEREIEDRPGYITNGIITIPHVVKIGAPFEIEVNQEEIMIGEESVLINVGGVSNIFAKTMDKTMLPISTKVAIDVPVLETKTKALNENNKELAKDEGVYRITEGTSASLSTSFTPDRSKLVYSDSSNEKLTFVEFVEGGENFEVVKNYDEISITAIGAINSTAKAKIFTFKNGEDQVNFFAERKLDSETQKYSAALQYLSANPEKSVSEEIEFKIVQANVSKFSIGRAEELNCYTNKLYSLSAGQSEDSDISLNVNIFEGDESNQISLKQLYKNVAVRVLKATGNELVDASEDVKIVGGDKVKVKLSKYDNEEVDFTFINSEVSNLNNAFFEVSSMTEGSYYLEFALLLLDEELNDGTYKAYSIENDEILEEVLPKIDLNFTEHAEETIGWVEDLQEIELTVLSDSVAEYAIGEKIYIPAGNVYRKAIVLIKPYSYQEYLGADEAEIMEYLIQLRESGGQIPYWDFEIYEIDGQDNLVIVKTPENFMFDSEFHGNVWVAIIKTDAYGTPLLDEDQKYVVSQITTPISLKVSEVLSKLGDINFDLSMDFATTKTLSEINSENMTLASESKMKFVVKEIFEDTHKALVEVKDKNLNLTYSALIGLSRINSDNVAVGDEVTFKNGNEIVFENKLRVYSSDVDTYGYQITYNHDQGALSFGKQKYNANYDLVRVPYSKTISEDDLEKYFEEDGGYYRLKTSIEDFKIDEDSYAVPATTGEFKFVVDFDYGDTLASLLYNQSDVVSFVACDADTGVETQNSIDVIGQPILDDAKVTYTLKFTGNFVGDNGRQVRIKIIYANPKSRLEKTTETIFDVYNSVAHHFGGDEGFAAAYDVTSTDEGISLHADENEIASINALNQAIDGLKVLDVYGRKTLNQNIIVTSSNPNFVEIVDNHVNIVNVTREASAKITITDETGACKKEIVLSLGAVELQKLEYLDYQTGNYKESANKTQVTVQKLGYENNNIELSDLLKIYIKGTEPSDVESSENYYFVLTSTTNVQINEMVTFHRDEDDENKITSLTIKENFAQDLTLNFNILGTNTALNVSLSLVIKSNLQEDNVSFAGVYASLSEDQKPQSETLQGVTYQGVYASHDISLNDVFAGVKWYNPEGTIGVTFADVGIDLNLGYTISGNYLKFNEVYEAKNVTITIYAISGNTLAYSKTLNLRINPNFKLDQRNNSVTLIDISAGTLATGWGEGSDGGYFMVKRVIGAQELPEGLSYEVTETNAISINNELAIFEKTTNVLSLGFGELSKDFKVTVRQGSTTIKNHENADFTFDMRLELGFDYESIVSTSGNNWMSVVNYDNKQRIFVVNDANGYDFNGTIVGLNDNSVFLKPLNRSGIRLVNGKVIPNWSLQDQAIKSGEDVYVFFEVYQNDSMDNLLATIQVPLVISSVGKTFAYYNSYNSTTTGFDLKTLLVSDPNNFGGNLQATRFTAGNEVQGEQILFSSAQDQEGIFCDSGVTTIIEIYSQTAEGLAEISGNNLILNNLAGDENAEVIIKVTMGDGVQFVYYYRVIVEPNRSILVSYPNGGNEEYHNMTIADGQTSAQRTFDISGNVVIEDKGQVQTSESATNVIKEIRVTKNGLETIYTLNGTNKFTHEEATYSVENFVSLTLDGDQIETTLYDKNAQIEVVVTKTFEGVANGSVDYTIGINMIAYIYEMRYDNNLNAGNAYGTLDENTWTTIPADSSLGVKTLFSNSKGENPNLKNEVDTGSVTTFVNMTYETIDGEGYTSSVATQDNVTTLTITNVGSVSYDYRGKKIEISITSAPITAEHHVTLRFGVTIYNDEQEVVAGQNEVGTLEIIIPKTVVITPNTEEISGGTTNNGISTLISKVEKYGVGNITNDVVTDNSTITGVAYLTKVSYTDTQNNKTYFAEIMSNELNINLVSEKANLIDGTLNLASSDNKIKVVDNSVELIIEKYEPFIDLKQDKKYYDVAMLKEDQTAVFEVTIQNESDIYVYHITKTFKKNLTYFNGADLKNVQSLAPTFNYEGSYYACGEAIIGFTNYLKNSSLGETGSFKFALNTTDTTGIVNSISDIEPNAENYGKFKIVTNNVSAQTVLNIPVRVTYKLGSTKLYDFIINVSLTVLPNTVGQVNYPNPTGVENAELTYETLGTYDDGDSNNIAYTISKLSEFFTKKASALANGNRIVFKNAEDNEIMEEPTIDSISVASVNNIYGLRAGDKWGSGEGVKGATISECSLTLDNSNNPGEIAFNVTCNAVTVQYVLYITNGSAYSVERNNTINVVNETETLYKDSLETGTIFANDRLVKLEIKPNSASVDLANYDGMTFYVEFKQTSEPTNTHTVSFKVDADKHAGATIYLEAGKSLSGYEYDRTYYMDGQTEREVTPFVNDPTTTERIYVTYQTKSGPVVINGEKIEGYVTKIDSTDLSEKNSFDEYDVSTLDQADHEYTATYSIKVGNSDVSQITNLTYKLKLGFDLVVEKGIAAENASEFVEIRATDLSSPNNLINLANIYHPSTGEAFGPSDVENGTASISVYKNQNWVNDESSKGKAFNKFYASYQDYQTAITDTMRRMTDNNTLFLTYTEIKKPNDTKPYDFFLVGEGAANEGSFVMIVYTYTIGNLSKDFYIMVRILPDYQVNFNGNNITSVDGLTSNSTSTNYANPYEVEAKDYATYNANNSAYSIQLTSTAGTGDLLSIIKTNSENPQNRASTWIYTIDVGDNKVDGTNENAEKTYNEDAILQKIMFSSTSVGYESLSNGWLKDDSTPKLTWKNGTALTISKEAPLSFGTKYFKVIVENDYGYKAYIYFKFMPQNAEELSVTEDSKNLRFTEGDSFDIGAVFDELTLTETGDFGAFTRSSLDYVISYSSANRTFTIKDATGGTVATTEAVESNSGTVSDLDNMVSVSYAIGETVDVTGLRVNSKQYPEVSSNPKRIAPMYTISASTERPEKEEPSDYYKLITLQGIKAFGYVRDTSAENLYKDQVVNNNDYPGYYSEVKMNLQYVTVKSIKFSYNGFILDQNVDLDGKELTPATKDNLKLNPVLSNSSEETGKYRNPKVNFTIPCLDSWIYTEQAQAGTSTDIVTINMLIDLQYAKVGSDTETYTVSVPIQVTRKLVIDKSQEAVVRDGEAFTISGSYIKQKIGNSSTTISGIYDDTLVVTLPEIKGTNTQKVTIKAEVNKTGTSNDASFEITKVNTLERPQTYYIYLSKLLTTADGKGYVLKQNDKITFTFDNSDGNQDLTIGGNSYSKFYASYAGSRIESGNEVILSSYTQDMINLESAELFGNDGNAVKKVIKSYIIWDSVAKQYYRVEKEYLVTPIVYDSNMDPETILNVDITDSGTYSGSVALNIWSKQGGKEITLSTVNGSAINSLEPSVLSNEYLSNYEGKLKFVVRADENSFGSAEINATTGEINVSNYPVGGNEYIHVYVYVKAAGCDGTFGNASSSDYLLGSVRLRLV